MTPATATNENRSKLTETSSQGSGLPGPCDLPESDVVIFDGDCRFCQSQVKRLAAWDGAGRLSFVSLHDELVAQRFPDLSHEALMKEIYVVEHHAGTRYGGAKAFRYLTRRLPRLWWLAPLMHVPFSLSFWQWGYNWIAQRRYQISKRMGACDDGHCDVHLRNDEERQ